MTVNTGTGSARELARSLLMLRNRAGLTTRALAEKIGASAANISNWERAERQPSEQRLVGIDALLERHRRVEDDAVEGIGLDLPVDGNELVAAEGECNSAGFARKWQI